MEEPKKKSSPSPVTTQFSDLPSCLVMDVLLRLPIMSLLSCRCVCKDWIRLFQDPYFIKLQLAASPTHILTLDVSTEDEYFQFGEVVEEEDLVVVEKIVSLRTLEVSHPTEQCRYLHSCNGLLCFLKDEKLSVTSFCICNPFLREWVSISIPVRNYYTSTTDLVFNAKNNQYKLLHVFQTVKEEYRFEIYTLGGTRQWRSIDETLVCRSSLGGFRETFLHGSLHWIDDPDTPSFIYRFDVDNERFGRRLSLPRGGREGMKSSINLDMQLGVVNGCLCVLYSNWSWTDDDDEVKILTDQVEIWCMKEYGVEKSWMMMLSFHVPDGSRIVPPLCFFSLNEGEILMYDRSRWLLSYNLKRRRLAHYQLKPDDIIYEVPYKPSLVSLHQVAKGEEVMSLRECEHQELV